jgi:hypothetical protein
MTEPQHSAGSAFLQIVPSFRGFHDKVRSELKREGKALGKDAAEAFEEGFKDEASEGIGAAMEEAAEKGKPKTKEAGKKAAEAYTGAFRTALTSNLTAIQRELKALKIDADTTGAAAKVATLSAAVEGLLKDAKDIKVDLDAVGVLPAIAKIDAALKDVARTADGVEITFNSAKAQAAAQSIRKTVDAELKRITVEPKIEVKPRELGHFQRSLRAGIQKALKDLPPIELKTDSSDAQRQAVELRNQLVKLLGRIETEIDLDAEEVLDQVEVLAIKLGLLANNKTDIEIDVDAAEASATLLALERLTEKLDDDDVTIEVGTRGASATIAALEATERAARGASGGGSVAANSFRAFSGVILGLATIGPLVIPVLATITAGVLALGAAAPVAGAGLAVIGLSFSGIGDAVGALGDVQRDAAKDAAAHARSLRTASNSVRDARLAVERSVEGQVDAQRNYNDALEDELRAQMDVDRARRRAADQLEDLALRLEGGAIAEREAIQDLADAQEAYNAVMASPELFSTRAKTNVEIELDKRRLSLKQLRVENERLAEEQQEANRTGVNGTEVVVAAQERAADAADRTAAAQRGIADAARSTEDAQRRLADAQIAYSEVLFRTGDIGSSSMQKLEEAMGKLSPAGQRFALFLHGLRDEFMALKTATQEGFLPGVQAGMELIIGKHGPAFISFMGNISKVMGEMFLNFANSLGSPVWQEFFGTMGEFAPTFLRQFGEIMMNLAEFGAGMATAFAPLTEDVGSALIGLTEDWAAWAATLKDNPEFQNFMDYIRATAPKVVDMLIAFGAALLNLAVAVAPYADDLMSLVTGFLAVIAAMNPDVLGIIAVAVIGVAAALQLMFAIFSTAGAIAPIIAAIALALKGGATAGATFIAVSALIVGAIVILGVAFYLLYKHNETFRKAVHFTWEWIKRITKITVDWFMDEALPRLITFFKAVGDIGVWLWEKILQPTFKFIALAFGVMVDYFAFMWQNVGHPIFQVIGAVAQFLWFGIFKPVLGFIWEGWKLLGEVIWFVITKVIGPVLELLGAIALKLWQIFIKPVLDDIGLLFKVMASILVWTWDNVLRPMFEAFGNFITDKVLPPFNAGVDMIGRAWDKLKELAMAPIRFIVETVINKGLIDPFNFLARTFGTSEIPHIKLSEEATRIPAYRGQQALAAGGPVLGYSPHDKADNIPAWLTANEFVQPVSAVDYYGVEFMEALRRRRIPRELLGFAEGGLVGFGRELQRRGFKVTEHPAFGGVAMNGHGRSSLHYSGDAIDVNWAAGTSLLEQRMIDSIVPLAKAYALRTIWRVKDHFNHAHFDTGVSSGRSLGDMIGGFASGLRDAVGNMIGAPAEWLKNQVENLYDKVPGKDSAFGQLALGLPKKVLTWAMDKVKSLIGMAGEMFTGSDDGGGSQAVRDIVRSAAAGYGWSEGPQWNALSWLLGKESSWNPQAQNPRSTAYGLFQFLNGTWAGTGYRKSSDPRIQTAAGLKYIEQRYGTPSNAAAFHRANNWYAEGGLVGGDGADMPIGVYDNGGIVPPGFSAMLNMTGGNEHAAVFTDEQWRALRDSADKDGALIGEYHQHNHGNTGASEILDETMHRLRVAKRGGVHRGP